MTNEGASVAAPPPAASLRSSPATFACTTIYVTALRWINTHYHDVTLLHIQMPKLCHQIYQRWQNAMYNSGVHPVHAIRPLEIFMCAKCIVIEE